jgi:hypothetical protein
MVVLVCGVLLVLLVWVHLFLGQYVAKFRHYILKTFQFTCASFQQDIAIAHITSDNSMHCLAIFLTES